MTGPLAGIAVVVTRPAHQAGRFICLLRDNGADAVAFPVLAVERVMLDDAARRAMAPDGFHWVIYTSANAVDESLPQLGRPERAQVGAIGRATAQALESAGIEVHAVPDAASDSEGLLANPLLARPRDSRILIVKGVGGRNALRSTLAERGALVSTAEVYRRVRSRPSEQAREDLRRARHSGTMLVVAVTSVDVLESLLAMAPDANYPWLRDAPMLLPGGRVAAEARRLEWRGPLIIAGSAEDDVMLSALASWAPGDGGIAPA